MERYEEIERSIVKRFRKEIWGRFVKAINEYGMIEPDDRIAVCISGGKDSMLLAKCMQEIQRHGKMDFTLRFIVMDPGYNEENRKKIEENAKILNIPVEFFQTEIFDYVHTVDDSPCYLCARMRRGYLYRYAQQIGCNKIALGHHFDDVIETTLMGMLYGGQFQAMMPKIHSQNFEGMELIRPLYMVKEQDILAWCRYNELEFIRCACRFTEDRDTEEFSIRSKRQEIKELIARYRTINPNVDINIFRSIHNVNLNTVIGYHTNDEVTTFEQQYEKMKR